MERTLLFLLLFMTLAEDTVVHDGGGGGNVGMAALPLLVIAPEVALGGAGDDVLQVLLLRPWLVGALVVVVVADAVAAVPSTTRLVEVSS